MMNTETPAATSIPEIPMTICETQVRFLFPKYSQLQRTAYQRGYRWAMAESEDWQRELVVDSDVDLTSEDPLRSWWYQTLANPLERDDAQLAEDYQAFIESTDLGVNTAMKVLPDGAVEAFLEGATRAIEMLEDRERFLAERQ